MKDTEAHPRELLPSAKLLVTVTPVLTLVELAPGSYLTRAPHFWAVQRTEGIVKSVEPVSKSMRKVRGGVPTDAGPAHAAVFLVSSKIKGWYEIPTSRDWSKTGDATAA